MSFVKTEPGTSPIVVEASFPAPPEAVYRAWTEPEEIKKWFGMKPGSISEATIDLTEGGAWRFVETADDQGAIGFEGRYLEIVTGQRLVFSWTKFTHHPNGDKTLTPSSEVEITFTATNAGTDMRIIHSSVDSASGGFAIGWDSGIANLVALLD